MSRQLKLSIEMSEEDFIPQQRAKIQHAGQNKSIRTSDAYLYCDDDVTFLYA